MGGQAAGEEAWDGFAACMARTKSPGTSAPFREHLERDGERHIDRMNPFGRQDVDRCGHRRRHRRQPGRNAFLLGGLRHHVQEYNRVNARLQTSLLFLATIAMLIPSAVSEADNMAVSAYTQQLSVGLSGLLIAAYGLGLLFSLRTHREIFGDADHEEAGEAPWPIGLALVPSCVS